MRDIIPQIDDLRIEDVFKDKNKKERVGVINFINGLVEILWLETEELRDIARQAFEPVKSWDKG